MKKEQTSTIELILESAQRDPFQTDKEIALNVDSTVNYVKTVLSENCFSLHKERKQRYFKLFYKVQELLDLAVPPTVADDIWLLPRNIIPQLEQLVKGE